MKIPNERIPVAYELAKEYYFNKKTTVRKESQLKLVGDNQMSFGSTGDFFVNFERLYEGLIFERTLNIFSMEYFVEHIFIDYGKQYLENSLKALKQHIEYIEVKQKTRRGKMRDLYKNFLHKANLENKGDWKLKE